MLVQARAQTAGFDKVLFFFLFSSLGRGASSGVDYETC